MHNLWYQTFIATPDFSCPEPILRYPNDDFSSYRNGQSIIIRDTLDAIIEVIDVQLEDRIFWTEEGKYLSMDIAYDLCRVDVDSDERYLMIYSVENPDLYLSQKLPTSPSAHLSRYIGELKEKFVMYVQNQSLDMEEVFTYRSELLSRKSQKCVSVISLGAYYEFPYTYEDGELAMLDVFPYRWWKWATEQEAVELFLEQVVLPGIFITKNKTPFLGLWVVDMSAELKDFLARSEITLHNR